MAEEMDIILCEVDEEVQVNEQLAEMEHKLLKDIASADQQLKIIREKRKLNELRKNLKRIHLNIIKLHDTLHQKEVMIQRETTDLENVSTILLTFLNTRIVFLCVLVPQMFRFM